MSTVRPPGFMDASALRLMAKSMLVVFSLSPLGRSTLKTLLPLPSRTAPNGGLAITASKVPFGV